VNEARANAVFPPRRGDIWGGLAAMLVALPAAIGFGVTVFSAIGPGFAVLGALAGIVGTVVIGIVASGLGGTARLVSAPCAPAAAVLSAFALDMARRGDEPAVIVLLMVSIGVLAGLIQVVLGIVGVGGLIKYIPYPVVSGYLTGVGLIIIGSQVPKVLGVPGDMGLWDGLLAPASWDWRSIAVGGVTAAVVAGATRWQSRVPGTILGIAAGVCVYFLLAIGDPGMLTLAGNGLVLGPLGASGAGFLDSFVERWGGIGSMSPAHLAGLTSSAITLAALLSIDTLKTCVVLDKLTLSRHDSNRELIAQGVANVASSACGGISGAGTMGATLVGLNSGAETRGVGMMQGLFALAAALMLGSFIAWIPVATLAGILVAVGFRMIDREPLRFLRSRATVLDFFVVLAVVVVAISVGLIAASAVGVGLAMVLFVREQSGGSVVRHKLELAQAPSTWHRPEAELDILARRSSEAVIFELQGTLFFGNTYRLYGDLEHEIRTRRFVIIDLKHVHSIDVTAAQVFRQVRDAIRERGARLLLCNAHDEIGGDGKRRHLLDQIGLLDTGSKTVRVFPDLDGAVSYVEDRLLRESDFVPVDEAPMNLRQMAIFAGYREETLADLESAMQVRSYAAGQTIYARGSPGDELFWVRKGGVRLMAALGEKGTRPVAGFGRGDYFGGLAFLDNEPRPNDAVALTATEVYVLSRKDFDALAKRHRKLAFNLASAMARTLAMRLRRAQVQLVTLHEY